MNLRANSQCQKQRLLAYLKQHGRITTLEARTNLDMFHPAARIQELKGQGHHIVTYRRMVNSGLGNHKIAEYVLLA